MMVDASRLRPVKLGLEGVAFNTWVVRPPEEFTAEDLLEPTIWVKVARMLRPDDRMEVHGPDLIYDFDLRVIEVDPARDGPAWARVRVIRTSADSGVQAGTTSRPMRFVELVDLDDLEVRWSDIRDQRWVVARKSDGVAVAVGFRAEQDAQAAIQPKAA